MIFDLNNYFLNPYAAGYFLVGLIVAWEGIFVFSQDRKSLVNLSYMLCDITAGIWLTGVGMIYISKISNLSLFWARYYSFLGIIFVTPSVYFFSLRWRKLSGLDQDTDEKPVSKRLSKDAKKAIFNFFSAFLVYLFCISSDLFIQGMWEYPWGFYPKAGSLYFIFVIWFYLIMAVSIKNFFYVYLREKVPVKKKQTKLILIAFAIAFIGSIEFLPNYGFALYLFAFLPVLVFLSMIGYCVIRYKLMDIETVLHKTLAWFLTNLVLVIPFVLILYLAYPWYSRLGNVSFLSFLSSLGILFLFFIRAFHSRIDHFFQRRRYGLEEIANKFTEDLVHLKGAAQLSQRLKVVIKETLYSQKVDLFIYDAKKDKYISMGESDSNKQELAIEGAFLQWLTKGNIIVYKDMIEIDPFYLQVKDNLRQYFSSTDSVVVVPLVLGGELLGLINLGKKETYKRYTALDFHFLTVLKNQSAIAISNSLLYDNMEDQVKKRTKELIDTQKQLIRAEKMATVGTLAGGVAHEINNPLTAILTNVQFLLSSPESVDEESLQLMEEATKRCRTIVQKLMLYARKPSEPSQMQKINILDITNGVVKLLTYQLKQENIKIEVKTDAKDYSVVGNQDELEQVITNLILNAKDAIQKVKTEGVIEIVISSDSENVIIKIKDEGVGIPEKDLVKIFDPFFTTKDVGKGTGLGLSVCQSIVQKHQGSIEVESEQNKGATFIVILPKAEVER